jgi:signal transduction histidine kinase
LKVLWTNNGSAYHVDASVDEITGRYCHDLFYGRHAPCEDCPATECFCSGAPVSRASNHYGRYLEKRAFPIKEGDGVRNVILLASDVTEQMQFQAEAMQATHLAALGELAAGVAHEINNPINGIINYAQILINECAPESQEHDIGMRVVKEGKRTANIVKSLLTFARGGREEKRPVRIDAVLKESMILTQAQIRKEGIGLKNTLPDDLPEVNANFQEIQQVFLNIINNARYAILEKYPDRHKNKVIEIHGEKVILDSRTYVKIIFYDRGMGIPAEKLSMLTMPFFSTKPFGKGTGLGLAIAHRIVSDHGGRLTFESVEGEFTRVIVDLPAKDIEYGQNPGSR